MAVKYYGPGEHPAGFIGFRVAVSVAGKPEQAYFSTSEFDNQSDDCPYFKRERLRAEVQDAQWMADSAWHQYQTFVTTDHPSTKPERGLGVHCLRIGFHKSYGDSWIPHFEVTSPNKAPKRYSFATSLFSQAWQQSVMYWAEEHSVLAEDRDRVLATPPSPSRFRDLRRQMVSEGYDIPVSALSNVFREQRQQIAAARLLRKDEAQQHPLSAGGKSALNPVADSLQAEIAAWFKSETA